MAGFRPYPFGALVRRTFRELDASRSIFDLPAAAFACADERRDLSVRFHGRRAATPFGPAAGPHSQLAQNIVLSWLAGARIIELKTVQVRDDLVIPRPCIDVRTVGFNVEWSQELTLEQSLEEYVKAAMLIQILAASGKLGLAEEFETTLFDISVGYDLAGITSERVRRFIDGMLDARPVIDRLRRQIPHEWRPYSDLAFETRIAHSVTLSTFHGCPPEEIERILEFLLRDVGLDTVLKINPTLLGPEETRRLLHDVLGYTALEVPDSAFTGDLTWDGLCAIVDRLAPFASSLGRSFGVKCCNTLVVRHDGDFLPASAHEKYLSGPPLHVLAMQLVGRLRRRYGTRVPLSFSGGIDRGNFADAVALGLVPVTVCTDLLKPGGYARGRTYLDELGRRMKKRGASTIEEFILRAYRDDERLSVADAALRNCDIYVARSAIDPRYTQERHARPPRKVGRPLRLFDCLNCDKCVAVCPNDANFTFTLAPTTFDVVKVWRGPLGWRHRIEGVIHTREPVQIGHFADLCNDCGHCDALCPEDGGPYRLKARFFGTAAAWRDANPSPGFHLAHRRDVDAMLGRFGGVAFSMRVRDGRVLYLGDGFALTFDEDDPLKTLAGHAAGEIDLTYFSIMNHLRKGVSSPSSANYVNCAS